MTTTKIDDHVASVTKHLNTINAQIKEKQVTLKHLEEEVRVAQDTSARELQQLEAHHLQRVHDLEEKVQPLAEEIKRLEAQKQAYMEERRVRLDTDQQQWRSLKAEKLAELRSLDIQIA